MTNVKCTAPRTRHGAGVARGVEVVDAVQSILRTGLRARFKLSFKLQQARGFLFLRGSRLSLLAHLKHRDLRRPSSSPRRTSLCRPLPAACSIRLCTVRIARCEGRVPHLNASINVGCIRFRRGDRLRKGIGRDLRHPASDRTRAQVGSTRGRCAGGLKRSRIRFRCTRAVGLVLWADRKSTRLNSSHSGESRMPSSA